MDNSTTIRDALNAIGINIVALSDMQGDSSISYYHIRKMGKLIAELELLREIYKNDFRRNRGE